MYGFSGGGVFFECKLKVTDNTITQQPLDHLFQGTVFTFRDDKKKRAVAK